MSAKRSRSLTGICLCCLILSGMTGISQGAEIEQPDVELSEVNEAIKAIESWINDAANNRSQL